MTIDTIHQELLRAAIAEPLTDDLAHSAMILFHTHRLQLSGPILTDRVGVTEVAAQTQRDVASIVAALWPDRTDLQRTNYAHWYWRYNTITPFEVVEDVPPEWLVMVNALRDRIAADPRIAGIIAED